MRLLRCAVAVTAVVTVAGLGTAARAAGGAGGGRSCDRVTATVGVGLWPGRVAVDPKTDMVYVADSGAGTVSVISGRSRKVSATIGVGSDPFGIAVDPATDMAYVANAGGKALASTDLALVRLRSGAMDGAATALGPVLTLEPAQRVSELTVRLAGVRDELAAPVFHGSAEARDLHEQIEEFAQEAVTAGLHSLADRPG